MDLHLYLLKDIKLTPIIPEPDRIWLESKTKKELERELKAAIAEWDFEKSILIRDYLKSVNK